MDFARQRRNLVSVLDKLGYIKSRSIRRALMKIPREIFVDSKSIDLAYLESPQPIPGGVTISAPHMHAIFLSALNLKKGEKVLEIGSGSGILLAYMKEIVGDKGEVYGIEFIPETYKFSLKNLEKAGYGKKVTVVLGDGSKGLPVFAPFDKIISSAASPYDIPRAWIEQLKPNGIIITPVGRVGGEQRLLWIKKTKSGELIRKDLGGVIFIELTGKYGWKKIK